MTASTGSVVAAFQRRVSGMGPRSPGLRPLSSARKGPIIAFHGARGVEGPPMLLALMDRRARAAPRRKWILMANVRIYAR